MTYFDDESVRQSWSNRIDVVQKSGFRKYSKHKYWRPREHPYKTKQCRPDLRKSHHSNLRKIKVTSEKHSNLKEIDFNHDFSKYTSSTKAHEKSNSRSDLHLEDINSDDYFDRRKVIRNSSNQVLLPDPCSSKNSVSFHCGSDTSLKVPKMLTNTNHKNDVKLNQRNAYVEPTPEEPFGLGRRTLLPYPEPLEAPKISTNHKNDVKLNQRNSYVESTPEDLFRPARKTLLPCPDPSKYAPEDAFRLPRKILVPCPKPSKSVPEVKKVRFNSIVTQISAGNRKKKENGVNVGDRRKFSQNAEHTVKNNVHQQSLPKSVELATDHGSKMPKGPSTTLAADRVANIRSVYPKVNETRFSDSTKQKKPHSKSLNKNHGSCAENKSTEHRRTESVPNVKKFDKPRDSNKLQDEHLKSRRRSNTLETNVPTINSNKQRADKFVKDTLKDLGVEEYDKEQTVPIPSKQEEPSSFCFMQHPPLWKVIEEENHTLSKNKQLSMNKEKANFHDKTREQKEAALMAKGREKLFPSKKRISHLNKYINGMEVSDSFLSASPFLNAHDTTGVKSKTEHHETKPGNIQKTGLLQHHTEGADIVSVITKLMDAPLDRVPLGTKTEVAMSDKLIAPQTSIVEKVQKDFGVTKKSTPLMKKTQRQTQDIKRNIGMHSKKRAHVVSLKECESESKNYKKEENSKLDQNNQRVVPKIPVIQKPLAFKIKEHFLPSKKKEKTDHAVSSFKIVKDLSQAENLKRQTISDFKIPKLKSRNTVNAKEKTELPEKEKNSYPRVPTNNTRERNFEVKLQKRSKVVPREDFFDKKLTSSGYERSSEVNSVSFKHIELPQEEKISFPGKVTSNTREHSFKVLKKRREVLSIDDVFDQELSDSESEQCSEVNSASDKQHIKLPQEEKNSFPGKVTSNPREQSFKFNLKEKNEVLSMEDVFDQESGSECERSLEFNSVSVKQHIGTSISRRKKFKRIKVLSDEESDSDTQTNLQSQKEEYALPFVIEEVKVSDIIPNFKEKPIECEGSRASTSKMSNETSYLHESDNIKSLDSRRDNEKNESAKVNMFHESNKRRRSSSESSYDGLSHFSIPSPQFDDHGSLVDSSEICSDVPKVVEPNPKKKASPRRRRRGRTRRRKETKLTTNCNKLSSEGTVNAANKTITQDCIVLVNKHPIYDDEVLVENCENIQQPEVCYSDNENMIHQTKERDSSVKTIASQCIYPTKETGGGKVILEKHSDNSNCCLDKNELGNRSRNLIPVAGNKTCALNDFESVSIADKKNVVNNMRDAATSTEPTDNEVLNYVNENSSATACHTSVLTVSQSGPVFAKSTPALPRSDPDLAKSNLVLSESEPASTNMFFANTVASQVDIPVQSPMSSVSVQQGTSDDNADEIMFIMEVKKTDSKEKDNVIIDLSEQGEEDSVANQAIQANSEITSDEPISVLYIKDVRSLTQDNCDKHRSSTDGEHQTLPEPVILPNIPSQRPNLHQNNLSVAESSKDVLLETLDECVASAGKVINCNSEEGKAAFQEMINSLSRKVKNKEKLELLKNAVSSPNSDRSGPNTYSFQAPTPSSSTFSSPRNSPQLSDISCTSPVTGVTSLQGTAQSNLSSSNYLQSASATVGSCSNMSSIPMGLRRCVICHRPQTSFCSSCESPCCYSVWCMEKHLPQCEKRR